MPTLAPKLPYTHPFAGGYPRVGGQSLPSDPDAIDYLARVAAADGAAVEVGVAMAVDAFVRGCKADSAGYAGDPTRTVWDALQASCIMCGARTISGALVPLAGTAPTGYGDWASGDYDRSSGLKGNGSTKYLDSNRAGNADGDNDHHVSAYMTQGTVAPGEYLVGAMTTASSYTIAGFAVYSRTPTVTANLEAGTGLYGVSRANASDFDYIKASGGVLQSDSRPTVAANISNSHSVFAYTRNDGVPIGFSDARIAFYSIGSAIPDLAALDNRVTQLITGIKFHSLTGLVATDYDPDTVAYIVAAYEAGGTL